MISDEHPLVRWAAQSNLRMTVLIVVMWLALVALVLAWGVLVFMIAMPD